jgi:hypothetical protein|tara:strand:- start:261 stop:392 length:132 start_codon:yes stop_codon:yes gene_type:complete
MSSYNLSVKKSLTQQAAGEVKVAEMFIICDARRRIYLHAHLVY